VQSSAALDKSTLDAAFAAGAAAQREADLKRFAEWSKDVELPFGGTLKGRHTFNVDYPEYVSTVPLEKP
jgi:hypothetical protein